MTGTIKNIPTDKATGKFRFFLFLTGQDGKSYFLHASDFTGHWFEELCIPHHKGKKVIVNFDPIDSDKGPRASNCLVESIG